ncbi:MAG: Wzz/FepE/Etk N-terminal domain-containing protein [Oscillospiraceae bacterium]
MNTEIDLQQIFSIIWNKLWFVVLSTVILGVGALCVSKFFLTPLYTASASMYVYSESNRVNNAITASELNTSQQLVQTYIVILTSNSVLDQVSDKLGGAYSAEELRKMMTAAAIDNTETFRISVTNADPAMAQKIANTLATVAPSEIIRVVKAGAVEVIDYATLPKSPTSPRIAVNTAIGALLGMVCSILAVIVLAMLDTAVRCEEDLTEYFNIPVIGVIPSLNTKGKEGDQKYVAS